MPASIHDITLHPAYRPATERPLKRRELEQEIRYGKCKIAEFNRAGMPHVKCRGQNLYYLSEVLAWLERQGLYDRRGFVTPSSEEKLNDHH